MPTSMTKRLEWDAGHRVLGHEGQCATLHGHRYAAEITVLPRDDKLDSLGRVIDFGVVKKHVGAWIDKNWDHTCLLHQGDPFFSLDDERQLEVMGPKEPYVFQDNPTAENIARELFTVARRLLWPLGVKVVHVKVFETPTSSADHWEDM